MSTEKKKFQKRDIGGIFISCLFIVIGIVMLWDTTHMLDSDSFVFPRAVAIVMIALNVLLIGRNLVLCLPPAQNTVTEGASTIRRVALIFGMLLSCLLMSYLGFLLSAIISFFLLMLVSMYDEWSFAKKLSYPIIALLLIATFYTLFSKVLLVPLPTGTVF
ncbi:MAG: hypothetical protein CSA34_07195 [Desulfobulbus propionicus]|nr:MAG: hypothetical protein CSA34_07195 [Desulfobulbus propionicus]